MKSEFVLTAVILFATEFSALTDSKVVEQLKTVNKYNLDLLCEASAEALEDVEEVNLNKNRLYFAKLKNIEFGLSRIKNLKHLNIRGNGLCDIFSCNDPWSLPKENFSELNVEEEQMDVGFMMNLEEATKDTAWLGLKNSVTKLEKITSLNISYNGLFRCWLVFIDFLEACKNLEALDISCNSICSISKRRLMKFGIALRDMHVRFLNLSGNRLSEIDVASWYEFISLLAKAKSLETVKFLNDKEEKFSKNKMEILKKKRICAYG
jgi:Leucine-rich repeat (LRR) protein